jgi:ubiquinone/menaquinone biosynthesis C-methylase UbiE
LGEFLEDWEVSYENLISLELTVHNDEKGYLLTDSGKEKFKEIRQTKPYWLYKYNSYFLKSQSSEAHRKFCNEVYGDCFSQHGMADFEQINSMITVLKVLKNKTILELGCGNGLITEMIQKETDSYLTGIDLSDVAINYANENIEVSEKLKFEVGNMNILAYEHNSFDAVIAIDTLYFADSLEDTINQCFNILKPNGRFAFFYTQWSSKDKANVCEPNNTELAKLIIKKKFLSNLLSSLLMRNLTGRRKLKYLKS